MFMTGYIPKQISYQIKFCEMNRFEKKYQIGDTCQIKQINKEVGIQYKLGFSICSEYWFRTNARCGILRQCYCIYMFNCFHQLYQCHISFIAVITSFCLHFIIFCLCFPAKWQMQSISIHIMKNN